MSYPLYVIQQNAKLRIRNRRLEVIKNDEVLSSTPLALDIVEEFRPVVDGLVLWCLNGGQIQHADFTPGPSNRPVIISDEGKRRFIQAFEQRFDRPFTHPGRGRRFPLRQCLQEQARQVADRLRNGPPGYQGMGFR